MCPPRHNLEVKVLFWDGFIVVKCTQPYYSLIYLKMKFLVHRLYKELQQDVSRAAFGLGMSFLRLALAAFTPALSHTLRLPKLV